MKMSSFSPTLSSQNGYTHLNVTFKCSSPAQFNILLWLWAFPDAAFILAPIISVIQTILAEQCGWVGNVSDVKKIGRQTEHVKGPSCQIKYKHRWGRVWRNEGTDDCSADCSNSRLRFEVQRMGRGAVSNKCCGLEEGMLPFLLSFSPLLPCQTAATPTHPSLQSTLHTHLGPRLPLLCLPPSCLFPQCSFFSTLLFFFLSFLMCSCAALNSLWLFPCFQAQMNVSSYRLWYFFLFSHCVTVIIWKREVNKTTCNFSCIMYDKA